MFGLSLGHIIIILVIVLIFFGVGKLPNVMGDLGKGVKAFKEGMGEGPAKPVRKPARKKAKAKKRK
ncbi:MAG TPA: twin-arginine translocase TatA/TatE family subunit [Alphaproteobacteria bacterium]|nr:twin-arginine translocase TatA/TatE family subunit [Alphaproteobacteria bacterium]